MTLLADADPPTGAVWMPDGSGTIELARLAGPAGGTVEAPGHLLDGAADTDDSWDLDHDETKIALYELCLARGSQYDIYRWVNLAELLRLWHRLDLPAQVRAHWDGSF